MNERSAPPVFLVGAPEAGTQLAGAILGRHPALATGPKTHFFGRIDPAALDAAVADPRWPELATAMIAHVEIGGKALIDRYELSAARIHDFLAEREPSTGAMLEALCRQFAWRQNKPRWVEATAGHILHVDRIRACFPDALILRVVRDPLDSCDALARQPGFSPSRIANAYLWRAMHDRSKAFFDADERSFTFRYEDLRTATAETLAAICAFIGERFDPAMAAYAARVEVPTLPTARPLTRGERRVCEFVCAEHLDAFGYERGTGPATTRRIFGLSRGYVERFEQVLIGDAANGMRWLPTDDCAAADKVVGLSALWPALGLRLPLASARLVRDLGWDTLRLGASRIALLDIAS